MNIISRKLPEALLLLSPLGRALTAPLRGKRPPNAVREVNLEEFSIHLQRDIGLFDGHATPHRHVRRDY
jgi:hypothetical protein